MVVCTVVVVVTRDVVDSTSDITINVSSASVVTGEVGTSPGLESPEWKFVQPAITMDRRATAADKAKLFRRFILSFTSL